MEIGGDVRNNLNFSNILEKYGSKKYKANILVLIVVGLIKINLRFLELFLLKIPVKSHNTI